MDKMTARKTRDLLRAMRLRYARPGDEMGPVRFAREVLKMELDEWQEDVLKDYGRRERRVSIRACHGPGKTAIAAIIILHHLIFRFPQKTVATAPSKNQIEDALFAEVISWMRRLPEAIQNLFNVGSTRIELKASPEDSFFSARTARPEKPEALQGVHSENVLLVADEASGVDEPIFEAAVGSMSGENALTLLLGNPTRTSGFFFETHQGRLAGMWKRYTIMAAGAAEYAAAADLIGQEGVYLSKRVTDDFVKQVAATYGEDSDQFRVRVLGIFPRTDRSTIISLGDIEDARKRDIEVPHDQPVVWGADIARYGDDKCALVARSSLALHPEPLLEWQHASTMESAGKIKRLWDDTAEQYRPREIYIDVIGNGAGVVDRLIELGLPVRGINVAEKKVVSDPDLYFNLRAELWFKARDWLQNGTKKLPSDAGPNGLVDKLCGELTVPQYKFASNGAYQVESKDEIRKRVPSPNLADAFVLTFAANASKLTYGRSNDSGSTVGWNTPIPSSSRSIV